MQGTETFTRSLGAPTPGKQAPTVESLYPPSSLHFAFHSPSGSIENFIEIPPAPSLSMNTHTPNDYKK